MKKRKVKFPCWVCKGQGRIYEDQIDYWVIDYPCSHCGTQGMIEVGSKYHQQMVEQRITNALQALRPFEEDDDEYVLLYDDLDTLTAEYVKRLVHVYSNPDNYRSVPVDAYWDQHGVAHIKEVSDGS